MFYRSVVQVVLLFVLESWVLSEAMSRKVEVTHTRFLRQIMGKRVWQRADRTWSTTAAEEVRESAGTQSATTYIG